MTFNPRQCDCGATPRNIKAHHRPDCASLAEGNGLTAAQFRVLDRMCDTPEKAAAALVYLAGVYARSHAERVSLRRKKLSIDMSGEV